VEQHEPHPSWRAAVHIEYPVPEAGEELPCHKPPPPQGGDYPIELISGHNRWSSHSTNQVNRMMLATHRGHPFIFLNPSDAAARGIADDDLVRVRNDAGAYETHARLSPASRRDWRSCTTAGAATVPRVARHGHVEPAS
jgi:anaerobic selenocysteine-containing dehydrogenase